MYSERKHIYQKPMISEIIFYITWKNVMDTQPISFPFALGF